MNNIKLGDLVDYIGKDIFYVGVYGRVVGISRFGHKFRYLIVRVSLSGDDSVDLELREDSLSPSSEDRNNKNVLEN